MYFKASRRRAYSLTHIYIYSDYTPPTPLLLDIYGVRFDDDGDKIYGITYLSYI